jgi:hypothetical protein
MMWSARACFARSFRDLRFPASRNQLASPDVRLLVCHSYLAHPQCTRSELVHSGSVCHCWGEVAQLRVPDRTGSHRSREDSLGHRSCAGGARDERYSISHDLDKLKVLCRRRDRMGIQLSAAGGETTESQDRRNSQKPWREGGELLERSKVVED